MHLVHNSHYSQNIAHEAGLAKERIHRIIVNVHHFNNGDWKHYHQFLDDMSQLIKDLENIKVYVEREEKSQLDSLHQFLYTFFSHHLVDKLDKHVAKRVIHLFNEATAKIMVDLKREYVNEKRELREHNPKGSFFKQFQSTRSLDSQIRSDAKKETALIHKAHQMSHHLLEQAHALSIGAKSGQEQFVHEVRLFIKDLEKEFKTFLEEQMDVEVQEIELIKELERVASMNPERKDELYDLIRSLKKNIKRDVSVAKKLFSEARMIRKQVKRAA